LKKIGVKIKKEEVAMKRLRYGLLVVVWMTSIRVAFCARDAADLPAGSAKGSLTYDGASAELKFAAAFVDQKMSASQLFL